MLICNHQLSDSQLKDVEKLLQHCQTADDGSPRIYQEILSHKRDTQSNALYYQQDNLCGFLSVYFFYDEACEVSLLVDSEYRKQGIACKLLQALMPLLQAKNIANLIFSSGASSNKTWLPAKGFLYQQSDYHMERNSYETILVGNPQLTMRKATIADIPSLCLIDEACFDIAQNNMIDRFTYLLNHGDYTIFLAFKNNLVLGKAHICWQEDSALFSDIAILPSHQGKGLGAELLAYCINQSLTLGKIKLALDVETRNRLALNLYLRHGFKVITMHDYWTISAEKLQKWLSNR